MESRHKTRSDDIDGFCSFRAFLYICNLKRTVRLFFSYIVVVFFVVVPCYMKSKLFFLQYSCSEYFLSFFKKKKSIEKL